MALGKKDRDSIPTPTPLEVKLNEPKRKRDEREKRLRENPKAFHRRNDDEYTHAFGTKWRTKRPGQIDLDQKTGQFYWGVDKDDVT